MEIHVGATSAPRRVRGLSVALKWPFVLFIRRMFDTYWQVLSTLPYPYHLSPFLPSRPLMPEIQQFQRCESVKVTATVGRHVACFLGFKPPKVGSSLSTLIWHYGVCPDLRCFTDIGRVQP